MLVFFQQIFSCYFRNCRYFRLSLPKNCGFIFSLPQSGLSMYFLAITVIGGKYRHFVGIVSALFFMFNPYTMIAVVPQMWLYIIFLPLILGLFIKGIKENRGLKYIFLMSLIWTIVATSDYTNPKMCCLILLRFSLYLVLHILSVRNIAEIKRSLRFSGLLLAVWSALNAFWIIPMSIYIKRYNCVTFECICCDWNITFESAML